MQTSVNKNTTEAVASPAYISRAHVRARGWSSSQIQEILVSPDRVVRNPYYDYGVMELFELGRVACAEADDERWTPGKRTRIEKHSFYDRRGHALTP